MVPRTHTQESKKQLILEAAERCIMAQGIEGVTMRSIASEAGINLASLHYYFVNKENLLTSLIGRKFKDYGLKFMTSFADAETPEEKIESVVGFLKRSILEERSAYTLLFEYLPHAARNEKIRELLRASYREFRESVTRLLDESVGKRGPAGVDTRLLSSFIISLTDGMWIQLFLDADAFDPDAYVARIIALIEEKRP
jgi:AcrR family transcriptional regulator